MGWRTPLADRWPRVRRFVHPLVQLARYSWLTLGVALLLIALAEMALELSWRPLSNTLFCNRLKSAESNRFETSRGRAPDWRDDYAEDFRQAFRFQPHAYLGWTGPKCSTDSIHIDARGRRRTIQPPRRGSQPPLRVILYGGSALWGVGLRDQDTIASYLAKELHERLDVDVVVESAAQIGYTSTQELLSLTLSLRNEEPVDLVIFLDGVNEAITAFQRGEAGLPLTYFRCSPDASQVQAPITDRVAIVHWRNLALGQILDTVGWVVHSPAEIPQETLKDALEVYQKNVALIQRLGEQWKFKTLFYWQPHLWTKQILSPHETRFSDSQAPFLANTLRFLSALASESAELTADPTFYDCSPIFQEVTDTRYIDYCHFNQAGSRAIAQQMAEDAARVLAPERATAAMRPEDFRPLRDKRPPAAEVRPFRLGEESEMVERQEAGPVHEMMRRELAPSGM